MLSTFSTEIYIHMVQNLPTLSCRKIEVALYMIYRFFLQSYQEDESGCTNCKSLIKDK